jgi:hypothetical protein
MDKPSKPLIFGVYNSFASDVYICVEIITGRPTVGENVLKTSDNHLCAVCRKRSGMLVGNATYPKERSGNCSKYLFNFLIEDVKELISTNILS